MKSLYRFVAAMAVAATYTVSAGAAHAANACTVDAASINFGSINVLSGAPVFAAGGPVVINCTGDSGTVNFSIGFDAGSGSGATEASRKMSLVGMPSAQLSYSLYQTSSYATLWGNSGAALYSGSLAVSSNFGAANIDIYGKIFGAQQTARAGAYEDVIGITIVY